MKFFLSMDEKSLRGKEVVEMFRMGDLKSSSSHKLSLYKRNMTYLSILLFGILFSFIPIKGSAQGGINNATFGRGSNPVGYVIKQGDPVEFTGQLSSTTSGNFTFDVSLANRVAPGAWTFDSLLIQSPTTSISVTKIGNTFHFFLPGAPELYTFVLKVRALCTALDGDQFSYVLQKTSGGSGQLKSQSETIRGIFTSVLIPTYPESMIVSIKNNEKRVFSIEQSSEKATASNIFLTARRESSNFEVVSLKIWGDSTGATDTLTIPNPQLNGNTYVYEVTSKRLDSIGYSTGKISRGNKIYFEETFRILECGKNNEVDYVGYFGSDTNLLNACLAFNPLKVDVYVNDAAYSPDFSRIKETDPQGFGGKGKYVYKIQNNSISPKSIFDDIALEVGFDTDDPYRSYVYYQAYLSDEHGNQIAGTFPIGNPAADINETFYLSEFLTTNPAEIAAFIGGGLSKTKNTDTYSSLEMGKTIYLTVEWGIILKDIGDNDVSCADNYLYPQYFQEGRLSFENACEERKIYVKGLDEDDATIYRVGNYYVPPPTVRSSVVDINPGSNITFSFVESGKKGFATEKDSTYNTHRIKIGFPADFTYAGGGVFINGVPVTGGDLVVDNVNRTLTIINNVNYITTSYSIVLQSVPTSPICSFSEKVLTVEHYFDYGTKTFTFACDTSPLNYAILSGSGTADIIFDPPVVTRFSLGYDEFGNVITDTTDLALNVLGPNDKASILLGLTVANSSVIHLEMGDTFLIQTTYRPIVADVELYKVDSILLHITEPGQSTVTKKIPVTLLQSNYYNTLGNPSILSDVPGIYQHQIDIANFLPNLLSGETKIAVELFVKVNDTLKFPLSQITCFANHGQILEKVKDGNYTSGPRRQAILEVIDYRLNKIHILKRKGRNSQIKEAKAELFRYELDVRHLDLPDYFPNEIRPNTELKNLVIVFDSAVVDITRLWLANNLNSDTIQIPSTDYMVSYEKGKTKITFNKAVSNEYRVGEDGYIFNAAWKTICWTTSNLTVSFDAVHYVTSTEPIVEKEVRYLDMEMSTEEYDYTIYSDVSSLVRPSYDTLEWDFVVTNLSPWLGEDNKFYNAWLGMEFPSGVTPVSLSARNTSNSAVPYTNVSLSSLKPYEAIKQGFDGYWVKLDTLTPSTDNYHFKLKCTYSICDDTTREMYMRFGSNYATYPTDPKRGYAAYDIERSTCSACEGRCPKIASTSLKFAMHATNIEAEIVVDSSEVDFCDTMRYATVSMYNANMSELRDIKFVFPKGEKNIGIDWLTSQIYYSIDNGAFVTLPIGTVANVVDDIDAVRISFLTQKLLPYGEVGHKVSVRLPTMAVCGFVNNQNITVYAEGMPGCGTLHSSIMVSKEISIKGLGSFADEFTITPPDTASINYVTSGTQFDINGTYKLNGGYPNQYAIMRLPANVSYVNRISGLTFTYHSTLDAYVAPLAANMSAQSFSLTLQLDNPALWDCSDFSVFFGGVAEATVFCEDICEVFDYAGETKNGIFSVHKKNLGFETITLTGTRVNNTTENVVGNFTIRNMSGMTVPANKVYVYYDQNKNNLLDAGDILLDSVNYAGLPSGGLGVVLYSKNIDVQYLCDLMFVLDKSKDAYLCETNVIKPTVIHSVTTTPIKVCQGAKADVSVASPMTGYTYTWSLSAPNSYVSLNTSNEFVYSKDTLISSNAVIPISLDLRVIRSGGCSSTFIAKQTVNVTPAQKIRLLTGNNVQEICAGNPIAPIQYELYGEATSNTVTPASIFTYTSIVSKKFSINTLLDVNTPRTVPYTIHTLPVGGVCPQDSAKGVITVLTKPIIAKLQDTTVCVGTPLKMAPIIAAYAADIQSYLWSYDGVAISTSDVLYYTPTTSGTVILTVNSKCGNTISDTARIEVFELAKNRINSPISDLCTGGSSVISVPVLPGTVAYQWYQRVPASGTWTLIPGATAASYTVNAQTIQDSAYYHCVITIPSCVVPQHTDTVKIRTHVINGLNTIYADTTICMGANITLTGTDLKTSNAGGYIWQYHTGSAWENISPADTLQNYTRIALTQNTSYRRTFQTPNCELNSNGITVTIFDNAVANKITKNDTICKGSNDTIIGSSLPAGTTINWKKAEWDGSAYGAYTVIAGAVGKDYEATGLNVNTKFVRIVNVGGCTNQASDTVEIIIYDNAVDNRIDISGDDTMHICSGTNSTLISGTVVLNATYQWQHSSNLLTWTDFPGQTGKNITSTNLPVGTWYYRRLVTKGTCVNQPSNVVKIVANALTTIVGADKSVNICYTAGNHTVPTATFSITGQTTKFKWEIEQGNGAITAGATTLTPTYTFDVSDKANTVILRLITTPNTPCATDTARYSVVVFAEPEITIGNSTPAICKSESVYYLSNAFITVQNYSTLNWTIGSNATNKGTIGPNDILAPIYTPSAEVKDTGSVYLILMANSVLTSGCAAVIDTVRLSFTEVPTIDAIPDTVFCNGDSVNFVFTGTGTNNPTFSWTSTHDFGVGLGGTTADDGVVAKFAAKNTTNTLLTATVTVRPEDGTCLGIADVFEVSVAPNVTLTSVDTVVLCSGNSVNYTATTNAIGATYQWSRGILPSNVVSDSTDVAVTVASAQITEILTNNNDDAVFITYTYTVSTDAIVGHPCEKTNQEVVLKVMPEIAITNTMPTFICSGENINFVPNYVPVSNPYLTATWIRTNINGISEAATSGSSLTGTDDINEVLTNNLVIGSANANYTYTLIYAKDGNTCQRTHSFDVDVDKSPSLDILSPVNQTICETHSITPIIFTTNSPANVSLMDTTCDNFILTAGSGVITLTSTAMTAGVYPYTVFIEDCVGDTIKRSGEITVAEAPALTPIADIALCDGGDITLKAVLSVPSSTTYRWFVDGVFGILSTADTCIYTANVAHNGRNLIVEATNACGTTYDTIGISVSSLQNDLGIGDFAFCDELISDITLTANNVMGATYQWLQSTDNGATYSPILTDGTLQNYTVLAGTISQTTYYKRVIQTLGCGMDTTKTVISVTKNVSTPISIIGDTNVCVGNTINLVGDIAPGMWLSMDNTVVSINTFGEAKGLTAGTADVIYTFKNAANCESKDTITIYVRPLPGISSAPVAAYGVVGDTMDLTITNTLMSTTDSVFIRNSRIANVSLVGNILTVIGKEAGNTEIEYISVSEFGCETIHIIPVQVEGPPTGIIIGKDIIKCNVPGGVDTAVVQIAYVMGGVAPWKMVITDDRGTFVSDTIRAENIHDFPINVVVTIPENMSNVPEFTNFAITYVEDTLGSVKYVHYNTVRIGTNPTPRIDTIANVDQVVCAGSPTLPISFNGVATNYQWHLDKNIGQINYLSDGIQPFIAINNTTDTINAEIVIIPEYWYNGVVCIGEPDTARITVLPSVPADFTWHVDSIGKIAFTSTTHIGATYTWDFDDTTIVVGLTTPSTVHQYAQSGSYNVALTVELNGCTSTITKTITVSIITDLTANFITNNVEQCLSNNEFLFTDLSTITTPNHNILSWQWDFGDGKDSTLTVGNQIVRHTYDTAGTYVVILTVTEAPGGTQSSFSYTVKVLDLPVITDGVALDTICEGERLRVTVPIIDWKGNAPVSGTWLLDGAIFDPTTMALTASDNGKTLQYQVITACGISTSTGRVVVVRAAPVMQSITNLRFCAGEVFPTLALGSTVGITYKWRQVSGDNIGLPITFGNDSIPTFTTVNTGITPISAVIEVTPYNVTCSGNSVQFTITVNQPLALTSTTDMGKICSGSTFEYVATTGVLGAMISWERFAVAGINNGNANTGNGAIIKEILVNSTDSSIHIIYAIKVSDGRCETITNVTVEVLPIPTITISPVIEVCETDIEAKIPYQVGQPGMVVYYAVLFGDDAHRAGFIDIVYQPLTGGMIRIPVPIGAPKGFYSATLTLYTADGCQNASPYRFDIHKMGVPKIIQQPTSVSICGTDGFDLSVEALDFPLSYQWYFNGNAIPGAVFSSYLVQASDETHYGAYYVEISNICGIVNSQVVFVKPNVAVIQRKWDDVLFVSNVDTLDSSLLSFDSYQWYKVMSNGDIVPLNVNGDKQYYQLASTEDATYIVEVKYTNGKSIMSCPYDYVATPKKSTFKVYPNPVKTYDNINIEMDVTDEQAQLSTVEVIDEYGRLLHSSKLTGKLTELSMQIPASGNYIIRVTDHDNKVMTRTIVIVK